MAVYGVSIHAPRAGRDNYSPKTWPMYYCFNPRAPCGARLIYDVPGLAGALVSIHAPRAGRDRKQACLDEVSMVFQSTRPVRGATPSQRHPWGVAPRFNPRAPCGARRQPSVSSTVFPMCFNPRAPCGARPAGVLADCTRTKFQSTRPVRGATCASAGGRQAGIGFNPRAPCGARQNIFLSPFADCVVSIHAPRAGRDDRGTLRDAIEVLFQSTRPVRGATTVSGARIPLRLSFNPRAPCGARPPLLSGSPQKAPVSIHAPRAGRDSGCG